MNRPNKSFLSFRALGALLAILGSLRAFAADSYQLSALSPIPAIPVPLGDPAQAPVVSSDFPISDGPFQPTWESIAQNYSDQFTWLREAKGGTRWAEDAIATAGAPTQLAVTTTWFLGDKADRAQLAVDDLDLAFISVAINDAQGRLAPRANNLVRFTLGGPGEVVAIDNGDPTSFESFQALQHRVFNGRVLVIVRTKAGQPGMLSLHAESDGHTPATINLVSK